MAWKNLREDIAADLYGEDSFADATTLALADRSLRVNEGSANRRERLLSDGLCPSCGLARDKDTQLCSWCAKKHEAAVSGHRNRQRSLGACANCGEPTGKIGKWKCKACTNRIVQGHAERHAMWKRLGLCTECGKPPAAPGRRLCRHHADVALSAYHARKKRLREATLTEASP